MNKFLLAGACKDEIGTIAFVCLCVFAQTKRRFFFFLTYEIQSKRLHRTIYMLKIYDKIESNHILQIKVKNKVCCPAK